MEKVIIGMSGGVDSSVAAAVLLEQGYEVIGVTLRLRDGVESDVAVQDAERVANHLKIPFHTLDFCKSFSRYVVDYFTQEYVSGRTPNPCIACNRYIKFDAMLEAADQLGADKIATGHYARVVYDKNSGRYLLKRSAASVKDQTYALYALGQEQLSRVLMPLGEFRDKAAVRQKAKELCLPVAEKPESMEICFVPDGDYAGFIEQRTGHVSPRGKFVDAEGNVLGEHRGIVHYTIGQRKGLGIAFGKPMFVIDIDAKTNQVMLGEKGSEFTDVLLASQPNFISFAQLKDAMRVEAKVRYTAVPALAMIEKEGENLLVRFDTPQRAVTPGQAVVFYEPGGDTVIGGAVIEKSWTEKNRG